MLRSLGVPVFPPYEGEGSFTLSPRFSNGTAVAYRDYYGYGGPVTLNRSNPTGYFYAYAFTDQLAEDTEQFYLTVNDVEGANIQYVGEGTRATGTIKKNVSNVSFATTTEDDRKGREGDNQVVELVLDRASDRDVTISVQKVDPSGRNVAHFGDDYRFENGTGGGFTLQTIPAGQTSVQFNVNLLQDDEGELEENYRLEIFSVGSNNAFRINNTAKTFDGVIAADNVIDIDSDNSGTIVFKSDDPIEDQDDTPGKYIAVNGHDLNGNEIWDWADAKSTSQFTEVRLYFDSQEYDIQKSTFTISYAANAPVAHENSFITPKKGTGKLRLWKNSSRAQNTDPQDFIISDRPYTAEELGFGNGQNELTLYIEGVASSAELGDETIAVSLKPFDITDQVFEKSLEDQVRVTLIDPDILDIDSDNDGEIDNTDWEEVLEDNDYGLGKILSPNSSAELELRLLPGLDNADAKVRFEYDLEGSFGQITLHSNDNFIHGNVDISLTDLAYDAESGVVTLEVRSLAAGDLKTLVDLSNKIAKGTIKATLKVDRNFEVSDEVQYVVTPDVSALREIQDSPVASDETQNRSAFDKRHKRAALASQAIYTIQSADLKHVGLRLLSKQELRELGISPPTITSLNNQDDGEPLGFTAGLYRDYTSSANSYIFAIAGTHIDRGLGAGLTDFLNNFAQGIADGSAQYLDSATIGYELQNEHPETIKDVVVTGHSLGGGLASMASIWGGMHGYTFNASGLTKSAAAWVGRNFERPQFNFKNDWENRYDNAHLWIDAYVNQFDILNAIQDADNVNHGGEDHIQNAIGQRHPLVGMHNHPNGGSQTDVANVTVHQNHYRRGV